MNFLRKYNTLLVTGTTAIKVPIVKRGVVDFAASGDWTPSAGDVKVWVDGTAANITNLPTAINSGNCTHWEFILTAAELSCKTLFVEVTDSATKAIEDTAFTVETFGHASAMYQADLSLANLPANVTQLLGTAWLTPGTAGTPDVNAKLIGATSQTGRDLGASVLLSSGTGTGQVKLSSGYVAPNWGDVGNPTTTLNLSGTTIKTATDLATAIDAVDNYVDTEISDIQARLPAALVGGRMDSNLQAAADAVLTAAKFGTTFFPAIWNVLSIDVTTGIGDFIRDTLTTIDAGVASLDTDVGDVLTRLPSALGANGNMKADVRDLLGTAWLTPGTAGTPDVNVKLIESIDATDQIRSQTVRGLENTFPSTVIAGTYADILQKLGVHVAVTGTVQASPAPTTTAFRIISSHDLPTASVVDARVTFNAAGNLYSQTRPILSITRVSANTHDIVLSEALSSAPSSGDTLILYPDHIHPVTQIQSGLATETELAKVPKSDGSTTWNATALASIQAETTDALNAYDPPTRTEATSDKNEILGDIADVAIDLADVLVDTGATLPAQIAALLTTAGAESYRADGATGSVFQLLYETMALVGEFEIVGTTKQQKKLDGVSDAFASTLDSATSPTSITRSLSA